MQTQSPQTIAMTMHYHTCSTLKTLLKAQSMIDDSPTFSLTLLCFASWLLMQKCATLSKSPKQMAEPLAKGPPEENTRSHVKPSICGKRSPMQAISAPVTLPNNASRCAQQCSATTHVHPLALNLAPEHYLACAMEADAARHALFRQISCTLVEEDVASL